MPGRSEGAVHAVSHCEDTVQTWVDVAVTTSYLWKVQSFKVPKVHSISIVLVDFAVTLVICGASAGTTSVESLEAETPKSLFAKEIPLFAKELPHRSLT